MIYLRRIRCTSFLFFPFLFLFSCDFSPLIHRDILKAQELLKEGNYSRAAKGYEEILKSPLDPEIALTVHFQLGEIYSVYLKEYSRAVEHFKAVENLTSDPLWPIKIEEKIGDLAFSYQKNFHQSARSYRELSEIRPQLEKFDFYRFRLALSLMQIKDYKTAEEIFTSIDSQSEYFLQSKYFLGLMAFQQKKWEEAINIWKQFLQLAQSTTPELINSSQILQARFFMANAYETLEELRSAYDIYYSLLGDYPNTGIIKSRLKAIYNRKISRRR